MSKFLSIEPAGADNDLARKTPLNPGLDAKTRATAGEAQASSAHLFAVRRSFRFAVHAGWSLVALGLFCTAVAIWAAAIEGGW
jgi:hypothetical protein